MPVVGSARVSVNLDLESLRRDGRQAREVISSTVGTFASVAIRTTVEGTGDVRRLQELIRQVEGQVGTAQVRVQVSGQNELREVRRIADEVYSRTNGRVNLDIDVTRATNRLQEFRQNISREVSSGVLRGLTGVEGIERIGTGIGQNIGQGIAGAVQAAVSGAINAVESVVKSSLGKSRQFETQLRSFNALSNTDPNSADAKGVRSEIERLGGTVTTKRATEIASGAIELTKLGFSAKETKKELAGLVSLAESTGATLAKSASIVGATNNVFQTGAQRISDVVAATANATAADADDFLQLISKAGGVGKSNNQSLETLAAAFGLIRNSGFEAQAAATGLKTAINRLSAPTGEKQASAIAEVGVQIRDSKGEMRNFIELIPEFRAAFEKFDPGKRASLVKTIFGDEGGPVFLALMSQTQEKVSSVYSTIVNSGGQAADTAKKLIGGLGGELSKLESSTELLQIKFGDAISPIAEAVVQLGLKAVDSVLKQEDAFSRVNEASKKFSDELANNDELAQALGEALGVAVEELATTGISVIKTFTTTLQENPRILADMVTATGEFIRLLGQALKIAIDLANAIAKGKTELDIAGSTGGAIGQGTRDALRGQGATPEEIKSFDKELGANLEKARLPNNQELLFFQDDKDRFEKIVSETANKYQDGAIKRNKLNALKEEAKSSDAINLDQATSRASDAVAAAKAKETGKPKTSSQADSKEALKKKKEFQRAELQKESSIEKSTVANIKSGESAQIAKVKQQQLSGKIDSQDASFEIEKIRANTNTKELTAAQNQLGRLNTLRKKGVIDATKFAAEEAQIKQKIQGLKTTGIDDQIKLKDIKAGRALDKEQKIEAKAQSQIRAEETDRNISTKQKLAKRSITNEQAETEFANSGTKSAAAELGAAEAQLGRLKKLKQDGVLDAKKFGEQELAVSEKISSSKIKLLDSEQKERDLSNRQTLEKLERANRQAEAAIAQSSQSRILEVRRAVAQGQKTEEQSVKEIAQIRAESTNQEIERVRIRLAQTDDLERRGVITAKEAADKRLELQTTLASKNQELVEQQIEAQKRLRDEAIRAIDDQIVAERRRSNEAIANLEREYKQTIEFAQKRDDIQRSLLESQASLGNAIGQAQQTSTGIQVSQADKAIQAKKVFKDEKATPAQKDAAAKELDSLGFSAGQSELEILKIRQQRENELSQQKLEALLKEQEISAKLLDFELRRLEFAQRTAEYEAQIGLLKAQQAGTEANGNMRKAEKLAPGRERNEAIANAQEQVKITGDGVALASEGISLLKEQGEATKEIIKNRREEQAVTQAAQRQAFNAGELDRVNAQRRERAALGDTSFSPNASYTANQPNQQNQPNQPGFYGSGSEKAVPILEQLAQQTKEGQDFIKKFAGEPAVEVSNGKKPIAAEKLLTPENVEKAIKNATAPISNEVAKNDAAKGIGEIAKPKIETTAPAANGDFGSLLAALNQGLSANTQALSQIITSQVSPILTQMQQLSQQIVAAASKPTNITVCGSPNPAADAVDIFSDIARNIASAANA